MKALLLSNVAAVQFAEYSYSDTIAAGVTYVPAAKTIVMTAYINIAAKLGIMHGAGFIRHPGDMGGNSNGYKGSVYCEGTNVGFKNTDVAGRNISLYGVSMS